MLRQRSREGVTSTSPLFQTAEPAVMQRKLKKRNNFAAILASMAAMVALIGYFEVQRGVRATAELVKAEAGARAIGLPLRTSDLNVNYKPNPSLLELTHMTFIEVPTDYVSTDKYFKKLREGFAPITPQEHHAVELLTKLTNQGATFEAVRYLQSPTVAVFTINGAENLRTASRVAIAEAQRSLANGDVSTATDRLTHCLKLRDQLGRTSTTYAQIEAVNLTIDVYEAIVTAKAAGAKHIEALEKLVRNDQFQMDRGKFFSSRAIRAFGVAAEIKNYKMVSDDYGSPSPMLSPVEDPNRVLSTVQKDVLAKEIEAYTDYYNRGDYDGYLERRHLNGRRAIPSNHRFITEPFPSLYDDYSLQQQIRRGFSLYALDILDALERAHNPPDIRASLLVRPEGIDKEARGYIVITPDEDGFTLSNPHLRDHQYLSVYSLHVKLPEDKVHRAYSGPRG